MISQSTRISLLSLALLGLGAAGAFGPINSVALAQQTPYGNDKSWTDSISSGFKRGIDKLGQLGKPKPPANSYSYKDDPISLSNKSKPGPELFLAVARLYEQSGKMADAAKQYQAALREKPDYLPALLGYARLQDRLGRTDEALRLYRRAVKSNPKEAAPAYNNMGLCHARQGRIDDAVAAMIEAVKLAPKNPLYRNNIASLLVDRGRFREAFGHLRAVHREAAAYYNMGYLLNKKGRTQAAVQHFTLALRANPSMTQARQWIQYLKKDASLARRSQRSAVEDNRSIIETRTPRHSVPEREPPRAAREAPPMPPDRQTPRRLPPTDTRGSAFEEPPLPGIYYRRPTAPVVPLPPPSGNSAIRPLPRVN